MRMTVKNSKIVSDYKRLKTNESGNIAFMTAVAMIPMVLMMGATVDFQKSSNTQTSLQSALDSAALFAASLSDTTSTALTTKAKPFFDANYKADGGTGTPTFAIINSGDSVTATSSVNSSNAFMKIAGIPTTVVGAKSIVKKSGLNLEVSMVLDNTGSMNSNYTDSSGITHVAITDLIDSSKKFIDTVMPAIQGSYYTKIAVIPYNNGVNLGSLAATARGSIATGTSTTPGSDNYSFTTNYQDSWNSNGGYDNGTSNWNQNGGWRQTCSHNSSSYCLRTLPVTNCVTERTGAAAYTDGPVSSYPVGRSYLPSGNYCNVQPIVPLSTNATTLKTTIGNMTAGGSTAGQVGIAWGWYTLSPNIGLWSGTSVPAGYDKLTTSDVTQKVKKVMILMTDGEYNSANYNGVITGVPTVSGSGGSLDHINQAPANGSVYTQANSMCSSIKASGVEVFVITFQLNTSIQNRVDLAANCATDANHIINADTTSLDAAFSTIANQIQAMRIAG